MGGEQEQADTDDRDTGSVSRRGVLGTIGGLLGAAGGYKVWKDRFEDRYGGAAFETGVALYDLVGDEIPTDDRIQDLTNAPGTPSQYITPEEDTVQTYAGAATVALDAEPAHGTITFDIDFDPTYIRDTDQFDQDDHWMRPRDYLETGTGDCEDYALAMASIMEALGHPSRVVIGTGQFRGERRVHAMTETRIDDTYYRLDVAAPQKIYSRETYDEIVSDWSSLTMFGDDTAYQIYETDWAETL